MNLNELTEKLKRIPHLRLPLQIDVEPLLSELLEIDSYEGYRLPPDRPQAQQELYYNSWLGRGLIDFVKDSRLAMVDGRIRTEGHSSVRKEPELAIQYHENGAPKMHVTDLGEKMPNTLRAIYSLCSAPGRTRISVLKPGGHLYWHSHCQFSSGRYENRAYSQLVVHIPLKTNSGACFGVTKFPQQEFGISADRQFYGVGEAWVLNSWHEHNAFNEGAEDRVHLMMYVPLEDPVLRPFLIRAAEEYSGALI